MIRYLFSILSILLFASSTCFSQLRSDDTLGWKDTIDSTIIKDRLLNKSGNRIIATPAQTARILSVSGTNDLLKAISGKAGVLQGAEGTLAYYIRGAGTGNNRVDIGGVPIYRNSHIAGLVSAFPSTMMDGLSFEKGGFSAKSGNFTSSVTTLNLKTSLAEKTNGELSVSPYISGLYIESPIGKKITIRASLRGSYAPSAASLIKKSSGIKLNYDVRDLSGSAYDAMCIGVYKPWKNLQVILSALKSADALSFTFSGNKQRFKSWESLLFSEVKYHSTYGTLSGKVFRTEDYAYHLDGYNTYGLSLDNKNLEKGAKVRFEGTMAKTSFDIGIDYVNKKMVYNTDTKMSSSQTEITKNKDTKYSLMSGYGDINATLFEILEMSAGVRANHYSSDSYKKTFVDLHIKGTADIYKKNGIEVSFDRSSQYFHVLEGMPVGWSNDPLMAASEMFPEEYASQFYAGSYGIFNIGKTALSITGGFYTKKMQNLVSFIKASHVFGVLDRSDVTDMDLGKGKSSGLEISVEVRHSRLNGELSYTYSRSKRQSPNINDGREYRFRFDRPHSASLRADYKTVETKNGNYKLNQFLLFSVNFSSGHLMTHSVGTYMAPVYPVSEKEELVQDYRDINNFRLPDYFRVDLGYTFEWNKGQQGYDLTLSVFNVLNRHNPYQYFIYRIKEKVQWKQLSLFGIMPSIRFNWKF